MPLDAIVETDDSENAVALTFDDAFRNFQTIAAPMLHERDLPVTLFVATAHTGGTNEWAAPYSARDVPLLPLLDWDGIAAVSTLGVSIGSHTKTHRRLPYLAASEMREELHASSEDIRRQTGKAPTALAYPYGAVTLREQAEAATVYDLAVGTELKSLSANDSRHLLPRIDAYYLRSPGMLESFGSPRFSRFLRVRNRGRKLRESVDRLLGQGGG